MTVIYESVEWMASFAEIFVLYKIYNVLFYRTRRLESEKTDIALAVIGMVITQFCNAIAVFSYYTMMVIVLYISICAAFIYKTGYITLFSIASFYILSLGCFDFLIFTLVSNFYGGYDMFMELISQAGVFRMVMLLAIKILWILTYFFLKKYLYKFSLKKNDIYTVLIISCAGFLGVVYLAEQTFKNFGYGITRRWFILLVFFALLLFAGYFVSKNRDEKIKLSFLEMRNELLEENYKTINEIYMSNSKLYHDLNNHLNVLYQLLDEGNHEEAKAYIKEIGKPIMALSKTVWTGVDVVDVVINSKLKKMEEKGIAADVNVEFPQNTNILPHDMCTILSNLLDNAIEAAQMLESPGKISLTIRRINHFIVIKVVNPCEGKQQFNLFPETTKANKELHGWGLPSVRDAVEKYNGTIKCVGENDKFIVKIILFFEKL
uniref:sensor histidine kinase n=1 Tax=Agathobacter sp. TaxID=2021311 RepID=UPI004055F840